MVDIITRDAISGVIDVRADYGTSLNALAALFEKLHTRNASVAEIASLPSSNRTPFGSPNEVEAQCSALLEKLREKSPSIGAQLHESMTPKKLKY